MRGLKHNVGLSYGVNARSHLLQMRGLKREYPPSLGGVLLVASFTDAWIETHKNKHASYCQDSRIFYRCVD